MRHDPLGYKGRGAALDPQYLKKVNAVSAPSVGRFTLKVRHAHDPHPAESVLAYSEERANRATRANFNLIPHELRLLAQTSGRLSASAILPRPYFTDLTVEKGGKGDGTIVCVQMKVMGLERP